MQKTKNLWLRRRTPWTKPRPPSPFTMRLSQRRRTGNSSADTAVQNGSFPGRAKQEGSSEKAQEALDACIMNLDLAVQGLESLKQDHRKEIDEAERLHIANIDQLKSEETMRSMRSIPARRLSTPSWSPRSPRSPKIATPACVTRAIQPMSLMDSGQRISKLARQIAEANGCVRK